jgi:glycerate kinase
MIWNRSRSLNLRIGSQVAVVHLCVMVNILVAFDKFKESMSAVRACDAAIEGVRGALGEMISLTRAPLTDGGEGFCRILTEAADGYLEYYPVTGPLGDEIDAPLGWIECERIPSGARNLLGLRGGNLAVIEMASVAGLDLVPQGQRHPYRHGTHGIGELIRSAVAKEASAILLGIGGSATSDLGLGALEALGLKFPETKGNALPRDWEHITTIAGNLDCKIPPLHIACDVTNPLLGPDGAAAVYGPQKGLPANEVEAFDAQKAKMARLLCRHFSQREDLTNLPGSGAAGGIGFGLKVACGAEFVSGFELVAAWLDLAGKVEEADLILTGEGKFDASSLAGKGPYSLLAAAHAADKPAMLFAGHVEASAEATARERFPASAFHQINSGEMSLEQALLKGPEHLENSVKTVLSRLSKDD